jgi:tetratricopeptide (TPR) repeat protein
MSTETPDDFTKSLDRLWNPVDPITSEASFQALLPSIRLQAETDSTPLVEILIQIARTQSAQRKLTEARMSLNEAENLLKQFQGTALEVPLRIQWLLAKGRLYISDKTPSQARANFVDAWGLAEKSGHDHFVVEIALMMAVIEPQKAQQDWILKAIEVAEKSPQSKAKQWLGGLYESLAWKLFDLRQFEKALDVFRKSLRHLTEYGTPREIFVAKWSTGKILRAMHKPEEALVVLNELLVELQSSNTHDGRLYEELAECLQTLQRPDEAQPYFDLAYKELSNDQWVTDNQPVKLKRLKELGKIKIKYPGQN